MVVFAAVVTKGAILWTVWNPGGFLKGQEVLKII